MKNLYIVIFTALLIFIYIAPTHAATMQSQSSTNFILNDAPRIIGDIEITADAANEITAADGIRIMIPEGLYTIWEKNVSTLTLTGIALDNGRVERTTTVSYPTIDARTVFIPVKDNFLAGETVLISGLMMRVYDRSSGSRALELDLNNDRLPDAYDLTGIKIDDISTRTDNTPPYPVTGLVASQSPNGVSLDWINPPDFDLNNISIERIRTRNGSETVETFGVAADQGTAAKAATYLDPEVHIDDLLSYTVYANDRRNISSGETLSLTFTGEQAVACTLDYTPVCGKDGKTYGNACQAEAAGIIDYTDGECIVEMGSGNDTSLEEQARMALAEEAGITLIELEDTAGQYSDLETTHWSSGFLSRLTLDGIISGYPDGTVRPDQTINRAELAKMAANAFTLPKAYDSETLSPYNDVDTGEWYFEFIYALFNADASWTSGKYYRPDASVTRGEALWVLLTAADVDLSTSVPTADPFPDVSKDHKYAQAIAWAVENSIVSGYENGNFGPEDTLSRAQVAKMIVLLKR